MPNTDFSEAFLYYFFPMRYEVSKYLFTKTESQPAITCSKLIIETLEQGVIYVQS